MATDRSVLIMENNLGILQLVDKVKAIFDTNLVLVDYTASRANYPCLASDPPNLDSWSIIFSSRCSLKSYLLTIDPDQLTDKQTKYLIESVFGDDENDMCNSHITIKSSRVLELISEDESVFYDRVMSMLFSLYEV